MKVKEQHLDLYISCPYSGKTLWVREIDPRSYKFYYKAGYEWLFEEEIVNEKPIEIKKTIKK